MTKKDFIRLLIKLLGVLVLFNSLFTIVVQSAFIFGNGLEMFLWLIVLIIIAIGFSSWLIFYPDTIINLFRLDKGFDDNHVKIDQLKAEQLMSIAVLVIGGLFILNSFSPLLVDIGYRIQASVNGNQLFSTFTEWDNKSLFIHIIQLCAGYLLITNYNRVTHFLISKNENNM